MKLFSVQIENIVIQSSGKEILSGINFELVENEVFTVMGKNGSGKTTLINSLTNLLDRDIYDVHGKITFNGKDILSLTAKELNEIRKNKIKYVFQDAIHTFDPLYKLKYYFENLDLSDEILINLLGFFNLPQKHKIENYYPYELSGGMAQRLSIALAASTDPDIIIMDEPTSSLDYGSANLLKYFIDDFVNNKNKSVLIISQDINFAVKISDKIAYLRAGKVQELINNKKENNSEAVLKNLFERY